MLIGYTCITLYSKDTNEGNERFIAFRLNISTNTAYRIANMVHKTHSKLYITKLHFTLFRLYEKALHGLYDSNEMSFLF